jgi:uncharacterized membrane protein YeaQ/YmgE (transglycosylase-associated protein family)
MASSFADHRRDCGPAGSLIMEGYGFGLVGNIAVGVAGSVIAGRLLPRLGFFIAAPLRKSSTPSSAPSFACS